MSPSSAEKPTLHVVCAVIESAGCDDRILIARRGPAMSLAGKWEFPGGKIEAGEENEAALVREIYEELECSIEVLKPLTPCLHESDEVLIRLLPFKCSVVSGVPTPNEHSEIQWVKPVELGNFDWAPADLPIIAELSQAQHS